MNATMKENKTMTLRQRLERWDTERRLARRRRQRAMEPERPRRRAETLPAKDPAVDAWAEAAEPVRAAPAKAEAAAPIQTETAQPVKAGPARRPRGLRPGGGGERREGGRAGLHRQRL